MAELELDILRKPEHSVFFSFEFKVITVPCSEMNSRYRFLSNSSDILNKF